jgi:SNF2 family DNA or RNA helicase
MTKAVMQITTLAHGYKLQFAYDKATIAAVKTIPGRRWVKDTLSWFVPLSSGNELARVYKDITGLDAPVKAVQQTERVAQHTAKRTQMSKAQDADISIKGLGGTLRPFQKAGVAYALDTKRVIIGDEMGLGKTVEALATIHAANAYPAVLVVPASVKLNWERESQKWLPGKRVEVINGSQSFKQADVYIINYDILAKHLDTLVKRQPKAVVYDEFHYVKNGKAKRSQAAEILAAGCEYVIGLSGTTVLSRPSELIHPLTVLGRLENFGGFMHFANHYCAAYRDRFGLNTDGASNLGELNAKLRSCCYIRREKKDVLTELPDKQKSYIAVPINNRSKYDEAVDDLIQYLMDEVAGDTAFAASIANESPSTRKVKLAARRAEVAYKARSAEHLVRINALKKLTAQGKMSAITEWIKDFLATGEKLVVFGHHKAMVQGLAREFDAPYIDGSRTAAQRQAAVDRFQNDKNCKLIVLNMQAGGVGITLTAASNVMFTELAWTPALHQQAEDRIHRIGQKNACNVYYLLGVNTIDEEIAKLLDNKKGITNAVNIGADAEVDEGILNGLLSGMMKGR